MNILKNVILGVGFLLSMPLLAQTDSESDTPLNTSVDSVEQVQPVLNESDPVFGGKPAPKNFQRKALVIGISAYTYARPLKGPVQDARLLANFWRGTNCNVYGYEDLGRQSLINAITIFGKKLDSNSEAIVFFSGHGAQYKGENYLVPSDAKVIKNSDLPKQAVKLNFLMEILKKSNCRLRVVFLDACRNELVAGKPKMFNVGLKSLNLEAETSVRPIETFGSSQKSLDIHVATKTTNPSGTLIAYATAPGKSALDAMQGKYSVFSDALYQELKQNPCTDLELCMRNVRTKVKQNTDNYQIPWASSSLEGNKLYLNQCGR